MKKKLAAFMLAVVLLFFGVPYTEALGTQGSPFSDVKPGSWYYDVVTEMAGDGMLKGYENGTFQPNRMISFGEFVAVVTRCVSLREEPPATGHWASGMLQAALHAGWYDWDECPPDSTEAINGQITRQVAAKVIMKAFAPEAKGDYSTWAGRIKDFQELDGRYYEGVFAAYQEGIFQGNSNGTLQPKRGMTRAECCAVLARALAKYPQNGGPAVPTPQPPKPVSGGAAQNGWLQVKGTQLCNEAGEPVVLRGMSSHGIQWYPQYTGKNAIAATADHGANVFRVAMYTEEQGYLSNKEEIKGRVVDAVDAAISLDMYVVIDWHILSDGDPNTHTDEAIKFFKEISKRYREAPNVIYEICNEPNGSVSWEDISRYAKQVIPAIRENSPKAVVICGTPTWSQEVDQAAKAPLPYGNMLYALHFYAGTHKQDLRNKAKAAISTGLPLFVSEWGVSDASGSGGVYLSEAEAWLEFLEENHISWINWSLCDKAESSAALRPGASGNGGWKSGDLSDSGKFVFSRF